MNGRGERDPAPPSRPGPASVLAWGAAIGLAGGLAELAAFLAKCLWLDPRNFNVSRQFPWMFPTAGLMIAAGPTLVLAAAASFKTTRLPAERVLAALLFPAYLGLLFRAPLMTAACLVLAAGLAWRTASGLARRADRLARRAVPAAAVALVVALALAAGVGMSGDRIGRANGSAPISRGPRPNVLLLVLDTVRAESLSLYGYGRPTSPNLERHAARGVRFDRAFSTAPWTAPSHAGMFTGKLPHELSVDWGRPLDGASPTLAEYLAGHGYDTAGFVANTTYCSYETGLSRGFARYEDYDVTPRTVLLCSSLVQRVLAFADKHPRFADAIDSGRSSTGRKSAGRINADFLRWLDARDARGSRPFFAFLNYYDAHHPYLTPDDEPDPVPNPVGRAPANADEVRTLKGWWGLDKRHLGEADRDLARDAYDRCVASLDRRLGALLDDLSRRGVLDDTLVIVTADHGEHLGEQGLFGHGTSLYRPELHVPLVVIPPGGLTSGRVVASPVSLRDLPATVAARLGEPDGHPFPGRSLDRFSDGGTDANPEPVRSEVFAPPEDDPNRGESPACRGPMTSLVAWGHHYVRGGDDREELFDLDADPSERRDRSRDPDLAPTLARFREALGRGPKR